LFVLGAFGARPDAWRSDSPTRTINALTETGRQELVACRDHMLRDTRLRPDPLDLALQYTSDLAEEELSTRPRDR
jgi:hypothetical protein